MDHIVLRSMSPVILKYNLREISQLAPRECTDKYISREES